METVMLRPASPTPSATTSGPPTTWLFGLPFTAASLPEVADHLLAGLETGHQRVVVTPNTDHVVRAHRNPELRALYGRADMLVADGMPVVWASSLLGAPLPERVAGVDLMDRIATGLSARDASMFLLGSTEGGVERAAAALAARHPTLRVAGSHHGYFDPEDGGVVRRVNDSGADALFVGMGSPKQERWATENAGELRPRIVLCVGGALEVLSGARRRAPAWMQRSGLEWSYRLLQEPTRLWRRYLVEDVAFVRVVFDEWRSAGRAVWAGPR
jgi:N-acetylglucosaminyldiphosphoundecaprenol N-acetyl-beta-D-mannosaminyltransferase